MKVIQFHPIMVPTWYLVGAFFKNISSMKDTVR